MVDSIVRKINTALSKEDNVAVCLPGAKTEVITERVEKITRPDKGGSILVHVGINNADRTGTSAKVKKYRQLKINITLLIPAGKLRFCLCNAYNYKYKHKDSSVNTTFITHSYTYKTLKTPIYAHTLIYSFFPSQFFLSSY